MEIITNSQVERFGISWGVRKDWIGKLRMRIERRLRNNKFYSEDGHVAYEIYLSPDDPHYPMAACHELGHLLSGHKFRMKELEVLQMLSPHLAHLIPGRTIVRAFRFELMAWRLAKSFCKSKYWHEERAIKALKTYDLPFPIKWEKFKIIPLYKI